jgi:hypothetical protein
MSAVQGYFHSSTAKTCSMNSLPPSTAKTPLPAPLAGDAGVRFELPSGVDPIDAWIDLMTAIEALCPRWPVREPAAGRDYRL